MRILVACEESQEVAQAFRLQGHEAWSCDLYESEKKLPYHINGNVLEVIEWGCWDMMIAHPPCTYTSNAGARFLYPKGKLNLERKAKGDEGKEFFMKLYNANIPLICIENPIPSKIYNMPPYTQIIQPYEFGHPLKKKTCLWLKGLPPLKPTQICEVSQSTKIPGNWFNKGGKERQKNRAKTFPGIAKAMANQWSNLEKCNCGAVIILQQPCMC